MEKILKEIEEIKRQQLAVNNLIIENGKQNVMIVTVLKNLLLDLHQEQESSGLKEIIEQILNRFDTIIEKLKVLENLEENALKFPN